MNVYLVDVEDDETPYQVVVRHEPNDPAGVARLVGESLCDDGHLADPGDCKRICVSEIADGVGVLPYRGGDYWIVSIPDDAEDDSVIAVTRDEDQS